jgi:hypothetical protein
MSAFVRWIGVDHSMALYIDGAILFTCIVFYL